MKTHREGTLRLLLASVAVFGFAFLLVGCPPKFPQCDTDGHCADNGPDGSALLKCCNNQCQECCADGDCPEDRPKCKENRCVECVENSDCPAEKPFCENEKCNFECEIDSDCDRRGKTGMVCKEHQCQWECEQDSDCSEGMVCQNHRCVPQCRCQSDQDCPEGQMCQDCECVDKPACEMETIYFDFDRYELRSGDQSTLDRNADCLKQRSDATVTIEGHCDDRGTTEYNIGLGDRRANAAKRYLLNLGIPRNRIKTISFGEERPSCSDASEGCYSQNRRCEFKF